jgi:hypothetical protein
MLCILLIGRRKKMKKAGSQGIFFPESEAGHALLAVAGEIFMAIKYN